MRVGLRHAFVVALLRPLMCPPYPSQFRALFNLSYLAVIPKENENFTLKRSLQFFLPRNLAFLIALVAHLSVNTVCAAASLGQHLTEILFNTLCVS